MFYVEENHQTGLSEVIELNQVEENMFQVGERGPIIAIAQDSPNLFDTMGKARREAIYRNNI